MFIFSYLFSDGVVFCGSKITVTGVMDLDIIQNYHTVNEPKGSFDPRLFTLTN